MGLVPSGEEARHLGRPPALRGHKPWAVCSQEEGPLVPAPRPRAPSLQVCPAHPLAPQEHQDTWTTRASAAPADETGCLIPQTPCTVCISNIFRKS